MRSIIITAAAIILATTAHAKTPNAGSTLTGVAHAKDGDGVKLGPWDDIRLQGIVAPEDNEEKRELGGPESTKHLSDYIDGETITCTFDGTNTGRRTHYRPVAICYLGEKDLGLYQVENGHARDCPYYSKRRYAEAEAKARASGKNLSAIYNLPDICVRP